MARGNEIIVSDNPRGIFKEGTIRTAEKPGTVLQIDVSEGEDDAGNFDWEVYAPGADGEQRIITVLLPDSLQGNIATKAYVAGDHCFLYVPVMGELLNMLFKNVAGTADDVVFGDLMMVDDATGKIIGTTGSPESEAFQALEAFTDPTADKLLLMMYTGH